MSKKYREIHQYCESCAKSFFYGLLFRLVSQEYVEIYLEKKVQHKLKLCNIAGCLNEVDWIIKVR